MDIAKKAKKQRKKREKELRRQSNQSQKTQYHTPSSVISAATEGNETLHERLSVKEEVRLNLAQTFDRLTLEEGEPSLGGSDTTKHLTEEKIENPALTYLKICKEAASVKLDRFEKNDAFVAPQTLKRLGTLKPGSLVELCLCEEGVQKPFEAEGKDRGFIGLFRLLQLESRKLKGTEVMLSIPYARCLPGAASMAVLRAFNKETCLECDSVAFELYDPRPSKKSVPLSASEKTVRYIERYFHSALVGKHVFSGALFSLPVDGRITHLRIQQCTPHFTASAIREAAEGDSTGHVCLVSATTKVTLLRKKVGAEQQLSSALQRKQDHQTPPGIAGLQNELKEVMDFFDLVFRFPIYQTQHRQAVSASRRLTPPRGMILYGPPGTGKTLLVRCVAAHFHASLFVINGAELINSSVEAPGNNRFGAAERAVSSVFRRARQESVLSSQSSLIFVDEIDALCPTRKRAAAIGESTYTEEHERILSMILQELDGIGSESEDSLYAAMAVDFGIIAATNQIDDIDTALRRPGRFDREIEIGIPNERNRREILAFHLSKYSHQLSEKELSELNLQLHGFTGADVALLCREAIFEAAKREIYAGDRHEQLTQADLAVARSVVKPSSLREVLIEVPRVNWTDIGGMEEAKQLIQEAVIWPTTKAELFLRMGITPPKGILLYGPPGCSKTLLAKAIATESSMNFLAVKGPELLNPYLGQSEKNIKQLFGKARMSSPCVVFFDEIDAISSGTQDGQSSESSQGVLQRVMSQLLVELDGIVTGNTGTDKRVVIIAATNRPDLLSKALIRPGRFDRLIYIPPPDTESRKKIFQLTIPADRVADDVSYSFLAERTGGHSGAEIVAICREAALHALSIDMQVERLPRTSFEVAFEKVEKQITTSMLAYYERFALAN